MIKIEVKTTEETNHERKIVKTIKLFGITVFTKTYCGNVIQLLSNINL